jgi:hypothetical protein
MPFQEYELLLGQERMRAQLCDLWDEPTVCHRWIYTYVKDEATAGIGLCVRRQVIWIL